MVKSKKVKKVATSRASGKAPTKGVKSTSGGKKKVTEPPTKPSLPLKYYEARVGCWNCDEKYTILIVMGHNTPQYLADKKLLCRMCGCDTLKMFAEYKIEKNIMKEVILHHRIEHMHDDQHKEPSNDQSHIQ